MGARPEDVKQKMQRTRLKDPGLTLVTWPRLYNPNGYLMGNADPSHGDLRLIAATLLFLH